MTKHPIRQCEITTDENGVSRPLMVAEVYGSVLPNALQNAVLDAAQIASDLAADVGVPTPELDTLCDCLIHDWPVLSPDTSPDVQGAMIDALRLLHSLRLPYISILKSRRITASSQAAA